MTDLDRLDALAAAATPGPWHRGTDDDGFDWFVASTSDDPGDGIWASEPVAAGSTAAYIAACDPATIRELVAAVRERDRLRAALLHSAEEAHVYGPDHDRRPIFECSYEPCRKARAALHPEDGT